VPLRPWLFRIAHNEAVDILRRRRYDHVLDAGLDIPALIDLATDLELRERLTTLQADLLSLCHRQRTALVLRELAGLSHTQIATTLNITTAAAKQTIYEARQALTDAETGRTTACADIQRTLSSHDRRTHTGRIVRAHLRSCAACRAFADD
jgi:RNA polymerase sigma factor (sigma-70 family)